MLCEESDGNSIIVSFFIFYTRNNYVDTKGTDYNVCNKHGTRSKDEQNFLLSLEWILQSLHSPPIPLLANTVQAQTLPATQREKRQRARKGREKLSKRHTTY